VANIRDTGVFCVNVVEYAMMNAMNLTSGPWPREVDEFEKAGIAREECRTIPCSRVKGAPASLECRLTQIVQLPGEANFVVFGEVTGVHLRDDCLKDGEFDVLSFNPLTRMGYRDYSVIREKFSLKRPGE
jgi:flavin reductase (DIM6/NTAB) family NADH-FMN oxidoreductase RutF